MESSNRRPVGRRAPADEVDERSRAGINRRGRDIRVPPVDARKDAPANERLIEDRRRGCLQDDDGRGKRGDGHGCTEGHLQAAITYCAVGCRSGQGVELGDSVNIETARENAARRFVILRAAL